MSGGKLMATSCRMESIDTQDMVGDTAGHRIGAENGPVHLQEPPGALPATEEGEWGSL